MKTTLLFTSVVLAGSLAILSLQPAEAEPPDVVNTARALATKPANPIINVGAIVHVDAGMMGGANDLEVRTIGTVVDKSGLALVSRSALNPQGYEPIEVSPPGGPKVKIESRLTDVWLQHAEGRRVKAEVVLTAPDLDLSVLRPVKNETAEALTFIAAEFNDHLPEASAVDTLIVLGRLGEAAGWARSVRLERITAVLDTPWRSYAVAAEPGSAAFCANGHLLGVVVALPRRGEPSGGMPPLSHAGGPFGSGTTVVLPLALIRGLIDQARRGSARAANSKEGSPADKTGNSDESK